MTHISEGFWRCSQICRQRRWS